MKLYTWNLSFWTIDLRPKTSIMGCIGLYCFSWHWGRAFAWLREQPSYIQVAVWNIYCEVFCRRLLQAKSQQPTSMGDPNQLERPVVAAQPVFGFLSLFLGGRMHFFSWACSTDKEGDQPYRLQSLAPCGLISKMCHKYSALWLMAM